MNIAICQGLED